ncbi:hypothetical protein K456DRAFT_144721 [Colletotrichum gloeosporioides 23]|nr:hypothetical protein K456DRAFT_144721 [Colletotrichum gloeosporioides 23]
MSKPQRESHLTVETSLLDQTSYISVREPSIIANPEPPQSRRNHSQTADTPSPSPTENLGCLLTGSNGQTKRTSIPVGKCHDTLTESTQCPPTNRTEVVRPPSPTLTRHTER